MHEGGELGHALVHASKAPYSTTRPFLAVCVGS